jgi:hypothetical protein
MALTDIHFQEGDPQEFLLEIPLGTLGTPTDILVEGGSAQYLLLEAPLIVDHGGGGGGNIFIMSE